MRNTDHQHVMLNGLGRQHSKLLFGCQHIVVVAVVAVGCQRLKNIPLVGG